MGLTLSVGFNCGGLVAVGVLRSMILGFFLCGSLLVPFAKGTSSSSSSVGFARFFGEGLVGFFCAFGRSNVLKVAGMLGDGRFGTDNFILVPPRSKGGGDAAGVVLEGVAALMDDDGVEKLLPPILSVNRFWGGGGWSILSIGQ